MHDQSRSSEKSYSSVALPPRPPWADKVLEVSEEEAKLLTQAGVKVYMDWKTDWAEWWGLDDVVDEGPLCADYWDSIDDDQPGIYFFFLLKEVEPIE